MVLRSPAKLVFPDNLIPVSAAMVRRDVVREVGGFRPYKGVVEDFDLWLRILGRGTGVLSPTITLLYHLHKEQMSRDPETMHTAHIAVAESYIGEPWWSPGLVERWQGRSRWDRLRMALARGRGREAFAHLSALAGHPQRPVGLVRTWFRRFFVRRRSSRVARDGGPSVAILPGDPGSLNGAIPGLRPPRVVDLRERGGFLRAWLHLVRRPTGFAVARNRRQALLLRLIRVRPLREKGAAVRSRADLPR
jgi:hypothetical protein